jgi:SNF2-related domain/Helicase conserved C-terminal domain
MTYQLRSDQIADLATLINNPKHIHGSQPGTGKTPTICTYQRYLSDDKNIGSLWLQPLSLIGKNYEEALRWGGWDPKDVAVVTDNNPSPNKRLYLMNPERLAKVQNKLPEHIKAIQIDESHKFFGNTESGRSQTLRKFIQDRRVSHFTPMTGTLYRGKPDSAYTILSLIEPRYYGNIKAFQNTHHVRDLWTGEVTGYKNLARLAQIIKNHSISRSFESIFGPQEIIFQREVIDLHSRQQSLYEEFEVAALLDLEKFWLDGSNPGTGFLRARQLLDHPESFPDLSGTGFMDVLQGAVSAKHERLELHLEDAAANGHPIIVYAALRPHQELIAAQATRLGLRVGQINGSVSQQDRVRIDRAFQAGTINCIIASPATADVGFNWQFCGETEVNHIVFASLDYDDSTVEQAVRRAVRRQRSSALRVTVLLYNTRVDWRILQIVKQKSQDASLVDPNRRPLNI